MKRNLTPDELRMVELRFTIREKERAERARLMDICYWISLPAGIISGSLRALTGNGIVVTILMLVWIMAALAYTGGKIVPASFAKDRDFRWQLNPWRDALTALSREGRQWTGIALFAAFPVSRLFCVFLSLLFG